MTTAPLHSKPHYPILDTRYSSHYGCSISYFEAHATSHLDQIINHGYLAVDFFSYCLFVISYAYDDRWGKMSVIDFFKRRFVRLQPMVIR
jgi:peptidoglycan/LPS O-acetylase OafA/YrhL